MTLCVFLLKELCKTLRLNDQDIDRIISLLPMEQKKKNIVMFNDDMQMMKLDELFSCFDIVGENVSIKIEKNIDELCKYYIYISIFIILYLN